MNWRRALLRQLVLRRWVHSIRNKPRHVVLRQIVLRHMILRRWFHSILYENVTQVLCLDCAGGAAQFLQGSGRGARGAGEKCVATLVTSRGQLQYFAFSDMKANASMAVFCLNVLDSNQDFASELYKLFEHPQIAASSLRTGEVSYVTTIVALLRSVQNVVCKHSEHVINTATFYHSHESDQEKQPTDGDKARVQQGIRFNGGSKRAAASQELESAAASLHDHDPKDPIGARKTEPLPLVPIDSLWPGSASGEGDKNVRATFYAGSKHLV